MSDPTLINYLNDSSRELITWVCGAMQLELIDGEAGTLRVQRTIHNDTEKPETVELACLDGSLSAFEKLWKLQRDIEAGAIEAHPDGEPSQISEIASLVLAPYSVREGRILLAGCTFDPRPFLRFSVLESEKGDVTHHWLGSDGVPLSEELKKSLNLEDIVPSQARLRKTDRATVDSWIDSATQSINGTPLSVSVVWCRWIDGKVSVQFDSGAQASIHFEGWARQWANGSISPPMLRCPTTDIESYNLVCLSDGTVSVQEAIGTCEVTGEEALRSDLEQCLTSGKLVLRDQLTTCPVTGGAFLAEFAEECEWCQRAMAPSAIVEHRCHQCRSLKEVDGNDAAVQKLVELHPELRGIKRWTGWVSEDLALLVGSRLFSEVMLVVRPSSGKVLRRANRKRLSSVWHFDA